MIGFTYMKTPLYKYTFRNKRIREWVESRSKGKVLNLFAGETPLNIPEVRNDLRDNMNSEYHMDAIEFVKFWYTEKEEEKFDTIILDPPYSFRKSMRRYEGAISSPFNHLKNMIPNIMNSEGIVITFGYHSNVMGKVRDFKQQEILLMSHGGAIHDTIAVIEKYNK